MFKYTDFKSGKFMLDNFRKFTSIDAHHGNQINVVINNAI